MRASSESIRSAGLHIGGKPAEGAESEQVGGGFGRIPNLTPLLPWIGARSQVPRLFILTLLYPSAEPGIFVLLLTLTFH